MMNWAEYEEQEKKHERWVLRRIVIAIGSAVLIGLTASYGIQKAFADSSVSAKDGSVKYVRHDARCDDADILKFLLAMGAGEYLADFKKGTLTYGGRDWRSCWIEVDGQVLSVDEEGAPLKAIPARIFKPVGPDA